MQMSIVMLCSEGALLERESNVDVLRSRCTRGTPRLEDRAHRLPVSVAHSWWSARWCSSSPEIRSDPRLVVLVAGVALWLAGHFLAAYKGRCWRSRLAESLVVRTPLRYIDPVNGRECRQNRREARNEAVEPEREPGEEARRPRVDHFAEWERELDSDAAPAPVRPRRPANRPRARARSARPSRGVVYGKRAAKLAATVATRTVPGARIARSALRFLR